MSLLTDEYPDLIKPVKVIPFYKGGETQDVNNYQPISLLFIFDKIIEKIMHKKLYAFLERQCSTVYALAQTTEMIKENN